MSDTLGLRLTEVIESRANISQKLVFSDDSFLEISDEYKKLHSTEDIHLDSNALESACERLDARIENAAFWIEQEAAMEDKIIESQKRGRIGLAASCLTVAAAFKLLDAHANSVLQETIFVGGMAGFIFSCKPFLTSYGKKIRRGMYQQTIHKHDLLCRQVDEVTEYIATTSGVE